MGKFFQSKASTSYLSRSRELGLPIALVENPLKYYTFKIPVPTKSQEGAKTGRITEVEAMNNNNKKKNRVTPAGRPVRSRGGPDRSAISPEGVYCNARFMQAITLHIGDKVTVYTVHGKQFEGYLKTFSKQLELVISMTHQVDPEKPQCIDPSTVVDMKIFKLDDIVRIEAKNVDMEYAVRDTFATDTAISKFNGVIGERELEPWAEDNLGTGDDYDLDQMCNHNVGTSTNGWDVNDMFKKNEVVYGVQSTFDQSLSGYTVQIQKRDTLEFKEAEARAAAIANEIENNPAYRARLELENGDEEDRFAAVTRPGDSAPSENGKYVPPAKRSHAPSTGKLMPRTISSGSSSSGGPPTPTPPLSRQDSGPQAPPPITAPENKPPPQPTHPSHQNVSQERHPSSNSDRHSSSSDRQYSTGAPDRHSSAPPPQDARQSHHSHHHSNNHHQHPPHSHSREVNQSSLERTERHIDRQHSDSRQDRHTLERQDSRHSQDRHNNSDRQDNNGNRHHSERPERHNSERHNQERHNSDRDRSQGSKYHPQTQNYHHNLHHTPPFPPPSLGYSGGPPPQAQPPRGPDPQQKSLPPQHRLPPGQTLRNGSRGGPRSSYSESTAPNVPPSHQHGPPAPRYGQPQPPPEHMKRAHHPPPPHPSMMIAPPSAFPAAPPSHQAPPPPNIVPSEVPQQRKSPATQQQTPPGPPPVSSPHENIQLQNTQQYPALPTPGAHYHHQHHPQQPQPAQQHPPTQQHISPTPATHTAPPPQQQVGVANTRQAPPPTHQAPPPHHNQQHSQHQQHTQQQQPLPQRKPRGRDDQISELKKFGSDFQLADSAGTIGGGPQHAAVTHNAPAAAPQQLSPPIQNQSTPAQPSHVKTGEVLTKHNMVERSTSPPPPQQLSPPPVQNQDLPPSSSPPQDQASQTPPSGDKATVTLKTSKLNPNAKEFKPFTPRAPSTPTPSRPHTPQTPSYAPQPQQQAPQPAPQPQGHTPLPMVITGYVPTMVTSQPQPPPPTRYRKSTGGVPVGLSHRSDIQQQMQVAAATGPPLLATAPMHTQFTVPYSPQGHLASPQQYQQMVRMGGGGMVPIVHAYPHESPAPPGPQYMSPHPHPHHPQHAPTAPSPNTMQGGVSTSQQQNNQGPTPPHHHYAPAPGVGAPQNPPGAYQQAPPPSIMYHPLMQAPPHPPHMIAAAQNSAMQQYLHQHHQAMGAMASQQQQHHIQVILPHTQ